jgi:hypothetical protein
LNEENMFPAESPTNVVEKKFTPSTDAERATVPDVAAVEEKARVPKALVSIVSVPDPVSIDPLTTSLAVELDDTDSKILQRVINSPSLGLE